jgi:MFS family permease
MAETYRFKPHEQPTIPGSPYNPDHPPVRMWAYGAIGILAGITAGLGNSLVLANIAYFQGTLGLSAKEAAWIPAAYVATNVCANLVLVKFRQQFGLALFLRLVLVGYVVLTLFHILVHGFWSAMLVRAASGIAAGGLTTLSILAMFQSLPAPKRLFGIMIAISLSQLGTPIARMIAPALLDWGDWRMAYMFELALALLTLAAVLALPLPPSERSKAFEPTDFLTMALAFPGIALLCSVLALGRTLWWTDSAWIGEALIGSIVLLAAAGLIEHFRERPLIAINWLAQPVMLRIIVIAFLMRVLVSEQTYAVVGLLGSLGMGVDQYQTLFTIVTIASIAGIVVAVVTFDPTFPGRAIQIGCLCIAIGAILDSTATNLTRPMQVYVSQAIVGFGALMFVGPAMVIGISRTLLAGPAYFISWVTAFSATQNLGYLFGTAMFGTEQIIREKFHSNQLVGHIIAANPIDAGRLSGSAQQVSGVILDPALRNAEGAVLLSQRVTREANVLAYNDVFLTIAFLAVPLLMWSIWIEISMRRRGECSPIVKLANALAAKMAAAQNQAGAGP